MASEEFFTHPEVEKAKIKTLFKTLVSLCAGLTIVLKEDNKNEVIYCSKNGLNDLVDDAVKDEEILSNRFVMDYSMGKYKLNMVLTYTSNYSSTIIPYANTGLTERGPHITTIKTLITREFNKFFREKGWIKEKEENLTGEDIQEGMFVVFNLTAPNISYDAQVKSTITKIEMAPFTSALSEHFSYWLASNEKEIKLLADKALGARRAREAAKKARDAARANNGDKKKQTKAFLNLPTKLVDCWSKDRAGCELFVVEGDSAAGGLIEARNSENVAVFPIRGKIISAYKNSTEKIMANAEVLGIIKAIGLELNPKTNKLTYDKNKLRYGKIFLAMDGDPDGAAIRNLVIEMFWWLCPELIKNGHLYTTMPPLFRVTTSKNEYIYLKNAEALEEYKEQHKNEKFLVNRNKGLGEQDAQELAQVLLDINTRNVAKIVVENEEAAAELIEMLLGPSVPPRREYLLKHSEEARD